MLTVILFYTIWRTKESGTMSGLTRMEQELEELAEEEKQIVERMVEIKMEMNNTHLLSIPS